MNQSAIDDPQKIIDALSPEDALIILRQLARQDENLAAEIAALAVNRLSDVDIDGIADALRFELEGLTPEDVWERAGETRYGYVETNEAAYQIIEELLEPYLTELHQCQTAGLYLEAEQMCAGLLFGFYQFEFEVENKFKDWATDAPLEFAWSVLRRWQKNTPVTEDNSPLHNFIKEELPSWSWRLLPLLTKEAE